MADRLSNPVGFLQEACVKYKLPYLPIYSEVAGGGPGYSKPFSVKCQFGEHQVLGYGTTKKGAKTDAASLMIDLLDNDGYFEKHNLLLNGSMLTVKNVPGVVKDQPVVEKEMGKHPVSFLQEYCQQNRVGMPYYVDNKNVNGLFNTECTVNGRKTIGKGGNKKQSKTQAALEMCRLLGLVTTPDTESGASAEGVGNGKIASDEEYSDIIKSPITLLKEHCIRNRSLIEPTYDHRMTMNKTFIAACKLGTKSTQGEGHSVQAAKNNAANMMIRELSIKSNSEESNSPLMLPGALPVVPIKRTSAVSALEEFLDPSDEEKCEAERRDNLEKEHNVITSLRLLDINVKTEPNSSTDETVDTPNESQDHHPVTENNCNTVENRLDHSTTAIKTEARGEGRLGGFGAGAWPTWSPLTVPATRCHVCSHCPSASPPVTYYGDYLRNLDTNLPILCFSPDRCQGFCTGHDKQFNSSYKMSYHSEKCCLHHDSCQSAYWPTDSSTRASRFPTSTNLQSSLDLTARNMKSLYDPVSCNKIYDSFSSTKNWQCLCDLAGCCGRDLQCHINLQCSCSPINNSGIDSQFQILSPQAVNVPWSCKSDSTHDTSGSTSGSHSPVGGSGRDIKKGSKTENSLRLESDNTHFNQFQRQRRSQRESVCERIEKSARKHNALMKN